MIAALLERLLAASIAGGLFAAAALVVCRVFPRLPAGARAALHWLAAARFVLGLLWPAPVELRVLPAAPPAVPAASARAEVAPSAIDAAADGADIDASPADAAAEPTPVGAWRERFRDLPWETLLAGAYLTAIGFYAVRAAVQLRRARQLLADAEPVVDGPAPRLLRELCRELRVERVPPLLAAPDATSPQLVGLLRPSIVLPAAQLAELDEAELRLSLAHELHHLKRRDLLFGLLPAAARGLFFFHPLARTAAREYLLAREAACDAAVLELRGVSPRDYGRLLLRLAADHEPALAPAAAAAPSLNALKRRLSMLQMPSTSSRWAAVLIGAGVLALVPVKFAARLQDAAAVQNDERGDEGGRGDDRDTERDGRDRQRAERDRRRGEREAELRSLDQERRAREAELRQGGEEQRQREAELREHQRELREKQHEMREHVRELRRHARDLAMQRWDRERDDDDGDEADHDDDFEFRDDFDRHGDSFVIVEGDSHTMSGSMRDIREADKLKGKLREPYLWFRRGGTAYTVTDAATVERARKLFEPQRVLGQQQSELGKKQSELGREQAALGKEQGKLGHEMGRMALQKAQRALERAGRRLERGDDDDHDDEVDDDRDDPESGRRMERITEQQHALGEKQGELGRRQGELGRQQGKLGREQGRLAREATRQLRELLDRAVSDGTAKKL